MKIQFLSLKLSDYKSMKCSLLSNPDTFDSFDINIIDLSTYELWKCKDTSLRKTVFRQDLNNLRNIIRNLKHKNVILLLPQDGDIYYNYGYDYSSKKHTYLESARLKNSLSYLNDNLKEIGVDFLRGFGFENNKISLDNQDVCSSFFFNEDIQIDVLQKAIDSEKAVTVNYYGIICTFLDLKNEEKLFAFLNDLHLIRDDNIPEWITEYNFFDDNTLKNDIEQQISIINEANKIIKNNSSKLNENNYYKMILYVNDGDLVTRVFKILDEMLGTNLTDNFVDKKQEDFLIKNNGTTFIGEIKGVSTNVRNEHISQVDNHLSIYEDKLQEEGRTETLKKLLIINHQRNVDIVSREPIHINQINKAKKENTLIIETITLLKLFSKYKNRDIDANYIFKIFEKEAGVLKIDDK